MGEGPMMEESLLDWLIFAWLFPIAFLLAILHIREWL